MMKDWHVVGQKVVCLDDTVRNEAGANLGFAIPKKGMVYTVRDVSINAWHGHVQFRFYEVVSPIWLEMGMEPAFGAAHFRPVRPTSIECFIRYPDLARRQGFHRKSGARVMGKECDAMTEKPVAWLVKWRESNSGCHRVFDIEGDALHWAAHGLCKPEATHKAIVGLFEAAQLPPAQDAVAIVEQLRAKRHVRSIPYAILSEVLEALRSATNPKGSA